MIGIALAQAKGLIIPTLSPRSLLPTFHILFVLKRIGVQPQENSNNDCGCPAKKKTEARAAPAADADEEKPPESATKENKEEENEEDGHHPYNSFLDLKVDGFPIRLKAFNSTLLDDISKVSALTAHSVSNTRKRPISREIPTTRWKKKTAPGCCSMTWAPAK